MKTREIFKKVSYTEQLEEILENKKFDTTIKNLLLSMVYKLDTSYNDYETVKRMVEPKENILEEILNSIRECETIELVDPSSRKMAIYREKNIHFKVDQRNKKIESEPNEKALLNAVYSLPIEKKVYLDEKYSAIRNALPFVLEKGRNINRAEIIRDFDAWSWNTLFSEIPDIASNLIFQNLQMTVGRDFLYGWMNLEKTPNSIDLLKNEINKYLSKDETKDFLTILFKLCIILCCAENTREKNRLKEDLEINVTELNRLNDKVSLIKEVSKIKTQCLSEIKKIDKILNNETKLKSELKKANAKVTEEFRILTLDDLKLNFKRQRKKYEKKIREANEMLDVKKYIEMKTGLENEHQLLVAVNEKKQKEEYLLKFQKMFIDSFINKVSKTTEKKDIINIAYLIRYYNFMPYMEEKYIKDVEELKEKINELEEKTIMKMMELKAVNKFSKIQQVDIEIIRKLLNTRIINLEKIYIEFSKEEPGRFTVYDDDTIENEMEINSDIQFLKYNKRIRVFS